MRLFRIFALSTLVIGLLMGCRNPVDTDPGTFTFKFINIGSFSITGLFLKPVSDTANWGTSVLPVARLDSLQYVLLDGLAKGQTYAFKAQFDSVGVPMYLIHTDMPAGPDTITGHAAYGADGSWSIGHSWGVESRVGEVNVTP